MYNIDMNITLCDIRARIERPVATHEHPGYELHYITAGQGWFETAGGRIAVRGGDCFYTEPGAAHRMWVPQQRFHVLQYVCIFSLPGRGDRDLKRELAAHWPAMDILALGQAPFVLFETLRRLWHEESAPAHHAVRHYFTGFLYECMQRQTATATLPPHPAVTKALQWMHEHVDEPLSLDRLATHVGLNKSYFIRLFKAGLGTPPGRYFAQLQMQVATALLEDPETTIASVAGELGFTDEFYFSRRYKQITGQPPSAARQHKPRW